MTGIDRIGEPVLYFERQVGQLGNRRGEHSGHEPSAQDGRENDEVSAEPRSLRKETPVDQGRLEW